MRPILQPLRGLWPVWVPVLIALVTFSVAVNQYPRPAIISDALGYTGSAKTLVSYHTYNHSYFQNTEPDTRVMPGYPLFLAAFYALGPGDVSFEESVRAIHPRVLVAQLLLAVATVGLIAACGVAMGGTLLGLMAGLLAAFYLPLAWASSVALTETLAVALVSLQLLVAINLLRRRLDPSVLVFLLLGLTTGLVVVVRPIYLPWIAVPLVMFAAQKRVSGQDLARRTAFAVLGLVLVLSPWWIRNAIDFHRFIPLTKQSGVAGMGLGSPRLAASGSAELSPQEQSVFDEAVSAGRDGGSAVANLRLRREWSASPVKFVGRKLAFVRFVVSTPYVAPLEAMLMQRDMAANASVSQGIVFEPVPTQLSPSFRRLVSATTTYQVILVFLSLVGLFFVWRRPRVLLVASLLVYSVMAYSAIIFDMRYFFPTTPALVLLAATAIAGTVSMLRSRLTSTTPLRGCLT